MDQNTFYSSVTGYFDEIFPLNPLQLEFIKAELGSLDELYFLDVGCSTGKLADELCRQGALGVGIDLNEDMIREAKEKYSSVSLNFRKMDMLQIDRAFPDRYFDTVICFGNTLVHLDSLFEVRKFLSHTAKLLKPGGKLLMQILNYDYILDRQISELPLIETGRIQFIRHYTLPNAGQQKIEFRTILTDKYSQEILENRIPLLPIRKKELEKNLIMGGFKQICFYANFAREPYTGDHLPLIVVAVNA
ncbi:MAG: class I SAM-dependent methyltransferase [Mangrovibacterium sp.]